MNQIEQDQRYVIECTVSGGSTGFRQGLLKSMGGIKYFDSLAEAQKEAHELNCHLRTGAAVYSYVAKAE